MENIYLEIDRLLAENPKLKESLKLFDLSMEEYRKAFLAFNEPHTVTSNSTNDNSNDKS